MWNVRTPGISETMPQRRTSDRRREYRDENGWSAYLDLLDDEDWPRLPVVNPPGARAAREERRLSSRGSDRRQPSRSYSRAPRNSGAVPQRISATHQGGGSATTRNEEEETLVNARGGVAPAAYMGSNPQGLGANPRRSGSDTRRSSRENDTLADGDGKEGGELEGERRERRKEREKKSRSRSSRSEKRRERSRKSRGKDNRGKSRSRSRSYEKVRRERSRRRERSGSRNGRQRVHRSRSRRRRSRSPEQGKEASHEKSWVDSQQQSRPQPYPQGIPSYGSGPAMHAYPQGPFGQQPWMQWPPSAFVGASTSPHPPMLNSGVNSATSAQAFGGFGQGPGPQLYYPGNSVEPHSFVPNSWHPRVGGFPGASVYTTTGDNIGPPQDDPDVNMDSTIVQQVDPTTRKTRLIAGRPGEFDMRTESGSGGAKRRREHPLVRMELDLRHLEQNGSVLLSPVVVDHFLKKRGKGLRGIPEYGISSTRRTNNDGVRSGDTKDGDEKLPPFKAVFSFPSAVDIMRAWRSGLMDTAVRLQAVNDMDVVEMSDELEEIIGHVCELYLKTLTEVSLRGAELPNVPYFTSQVLPQIYDRELLHDIVTSGRCELRFSAKIWNLAVQSFERFLKRCGETKGKVSQVPWDWRYCQVHGLQRDHDDRICPVLVEPNFDKSVTAATIIGRKTDWSSWIRPTSAEDEWVTCKAAEVVKSRQSNEAGRKSKQTTNETSSDGGPGNAKVNQ